MHKPSALLSPLTLTAILLNLLASCNGSVSGNKTENYPPPVSIPQQSTASKASTVQVIDQNIRCIFQDKKGVYWFGTNGAGVYRYNNKALTQFTVKDGLADNQVLRIQEDDLGNIWFGTGSFGVSKFDGSKFKSYTQTGHLKIMQGSLSDWKSNPNELWFYAGGGVFRSRNESLDYLPFAPSSANAKSRNNAPFTLSRYAVYSLLKDKKGNLWFGTQAQGVCRYDGKSLKWFTEKGLAGPAVLGLFEDSKGNLWFGNNGAGLFRYDGHTLINVTAEKGLGNADFRASGKSGVGTLARVYSINEDILGNIWVGTVDAGVWKYDGNTLTNYTTKDGLTSNAVNTIYRDNNGVLWFGTDSNGICLFNGTTFTEWIIK